LDTVLFGVLHLYSFVWCPAPILNNFNIVLFDSFWRAVQNQIPSKVTLFRIGIVGSEELHWVEGCGKQEKIAHLFFDHLDGD
jgi:hypothetical protein